MNTNLQRDDVRRKGVRNSPDVFAQGVIFGARASHRAPGPRLIPSAALRREEERGGADKQRESSEAQRPAAVSHPVTPEQELLLRRSRL